MKIYNTVYTTQWEIWEMDTENLKCLGSTNIVSDYKKGVGHYGYCYDNEFYKTRDAAERYIRREYVSPDEIVRIPRN